MKESFRKSDANGSLAAACLVLMLGTFGLTVLAFIVFPATPLGALAIFGGAAALGALMLWMLFPKLELPSISLGWWRRRDTREELGYNPVPIKPHTPRYGTNTPPSLELIKDLKEGLNNWVPAPGVKTPPQARADDSKSR